MYKITWIQDEVQTGYGVTGKMWYSQYLEAEPDIITFGKKVQVSGIMAKKQIKEIFQKPIRLEVTWDGDLVDMVRSYFILKAYKKYDILKNVNERGKQLFTGFSKIKGIKNLRHQGLLFCFDFDSGGERDGFVRRAFSNGLLTSRAGEKSLRLRPNLAVSERECALAVELTAKSLE